jgi:hypothetical protein
MQNSSFNDLIGLPCQWGAAPWSGKTDCFQLACEVRRRLGLSDYANRFEWVYELYNENTFPNGLLVRWMLENGVRTHQPVIGTVVLLPAAIGSALGTIVEDGALFLSPGGMVVKAPLPGNIGHYFWMNQ